MATIDELRYPIGKFNVPASYDDSDLKSWIKVIEELPALLQNEIHNLGTAELSKRYRPEGWTISQVVHHLADSHMNSFVRFKLAMTEENPPAKPYAEDLWAEMPDEIDLHPQVSLNLLVPLHERWTYMLHTMTQADFITKGYYHPDKKRVVPLYEATALYAWHSKHHLAHIRNAKKN